jgi:predicted MFS family arabinose efflux permease
MDRPREGSPSMSSPEAQAFAEMQQPAVPRAAAGYLAVVQFLFATMWVVYVLFLPGLAESVGVRRELVIWILMLDQVTFVVMDFAMGVAADRVARLFGRLALPIVVTSAVSCLAFLLIPLVSGLGEVNQPGAEALFFGLILIWSATSSVLRAPPWVLLSKYAALPSVPWLAALSLIGLSVANAIAPYLGVVLRNVDPRVPFALSSVSLFAITAGLLWVERALARQSAGPVGRSDARPGSDRPDGVGGTAPEATAGIQVARLLLAVFVVGAGILAFGFQAYTSFDSAAQYLRFAQPTDLELLLPIFWIGFNVLSFPAALLASRIGSLSIMAWAGVIGAIGTVISALAPNLLLTILGQLLAGGAWGCVLTAGLSAAIGLGRPAREGATLGLWFSVQAIATVIRMALVAGEINKAPEFSALVTWVPAVLWLASALLLAVALARAGRLSVSQRASV